MLSILIFCLFLANYAHGQTINKLDEKNGFKDFKLGDSYTKWSNYLTFDGTWKDGSKAYVYTGNCCNTVFEYDIESIILRFYSEKLVAIILTTKKFQESFDVSGQYTNWRSKDFESIKTSFSILFGPPTGLDKGENTGTITHSWIGKKVVLFSVYEYLGTISGDRQKIIIGDLNFSNSDIQNGF